MDKEKKGTTTTKQLQKSRWDKLNVNSEKPNISSLSSSSLSSIEIRAIFVRRNRKAKLSFQNADGRYSGLHSYIFQSVWNIVNSFSLQKRIFTSSGVILLLKAFRKAKYSSVHFPTLPMYKNKCPNVVHGE